MHSNEIPNTVAGIKESFPDIHRQSWKTAGLPVEGSLPHKNSTWQEADGNTCSLQIPKCENGGSRALTPQPNKLLFLPWRGTCDGRRTRSITGVAVLPHRNQAKEHYPHNAILKTRLS